jgi:hypothetical protein
VLFRLALKVGTNFNEENYPNSFNRDELGILEDLNAFLAARRISKVERELERRFTLPEGL